MQIPDWHSPASVVVAAVVQVPVAIPLPFLYSHLQLWPIETRSLAFEVIRELVEALLLQSEVELPQQIV